jgi:hypothetical protein
LPGPQAASNAGSIKIATMGARLIAFPLRPEAARSAPAETE